MRKFIVGLLIILGTATASHAQTGTIKGTVTDTVEKKNLVNSVVTLLRKSDSSLFTFTRTNKKGEFVISNAPAGSYVIMITYPRYADFADELSVKSSETSDLGSLILTEKSVLLKEVIVHSVGAIRIKGDTTEFVADSFKVKEGATVEDLLKKLPGLSVNSKGEITAQGKKVDKVLVDGEEFFGDDPTIATQNIAAKQVEKVQVFDTKTDQDQIKGIGGNTDSKTINIKLKDSAKKGYFGKVEAGSDFDRLHNGRILYNNFLGKRKISMFGTKSNTNTGSLGWEDRNKLGIENDFEYDEIGGFYYSFGSNDDFNDWGLQGLPNAYTAGALYSNKWNEDKNNLNLSYSYNRLGTTNISSTLKETLLPDTIFYNNENSNTRGLKQQNVFNGKYEWKIDSLTSLKFSTVNTYKTTETSSSTTSEALDENQQLVNRGVRTNTQDITHKQSDNQLTYKQLFRKKGRLLIGTFRYSNINDINNGTLNSTNEFFRNGIDSVAITDQLKTGTGKSQTFGGKITYNEPLNTKWNLVTEYSYNKNSSTAHRNTFEKDPDGKYTVLDPVFSNNFDLDAYANTGIITLRYLGKKLRSVVGGGISAVQLGVNDLDNNNKHIYNFTNFTPQVQFGYNLKAQTNISFRYNGTTRQPTIDQLQPIRNNNDPLNIYIGNPNLKVGFNHSLNLSYNSFKILKSRYMYVGIGYNFLQNAIANNSTVDSFGKITTMPVNVHGSNNYFMYGGWVSGQGDKKLIHEINSNVNGGRSVTFINGQESINDYANIQFSYGIGYSIQDKYNFHIRPKIGRNISQSSLRKDVNNSYWTYGGDIDGYLMLPWKLEITSDVNFDLRQQIDAFAGSNTNIIYWNAELSRKIFKKKAAKIIFRANDILDQNKGFNRVINSNFVTDQRYQRIGQYFMLSFQWTFTKMPGQK
ncbi:MAG TPA: TonB-dependent receptor [Chitinophagaceae bacterium]|nr:TonB-dependent receptor [Chitinophagaceae bacterium]